jgi:hypothetical protein
VQVAATSVARTTVFAHRGNSAAIGRVSYVAPTDTE